MISVCILEEESGKVLAFLKAALGDRASDFAFDNALLKECYDFVLWHEGKATSVANARVLAVLDEQAHRAVKAVTAPMVATYGLSAKNTLTVSANMEKKVVTLQREVKTLAGRPILPMDIPIECPLPLCDALGAALACLICDCLIK